MRGERGRRKFHEKQGQGESSGTRVKVEEGVKGLMVDECFQRVSHCIAPGIGERERERDGMGLCTPRGPTSTLIARFQPPSPFIRRLLPPRPHPDPRRAV